MSADFLPPDPQLRDALAALPAPVPPEGGWTRLQATLSSRRQRRRRRAGLALAASLAALAIVFAAIDRSAPTAPPTARPTIVAGASTPGEAELVETALSALVAQSAGLEAELAWMDGGLSSADALAADLALVERLQWLDRLLAEPGSSEATREVLWRQRVELLGQRAALGRQDLLAAAHGESRALAIAL